MKRTSSRSAAVLSGLALLAAALTCTIVGSSPAGATPQSITMGCDASELSGNPPPNVPFEVTIDGVTPGVAFPTGASVPLTNVDISITMPGFLVGSLRQTFGDNGNGLQFGIAQAKIGVAATHASPAFEYNTSNADIHAPLVTVTNYNPTGGPGGSPIADPITWHVSNVPYAAFTSSGANGDTMAFTPYSPGSGFIVNIHNHSIFTFINATGFGTLNAGTPDAGPGTGNCHDNVAASGPFATTTLGDPPPTVNAATFSAIGGTDSTLIVTGSAPGDPTGIDSSTWSATTPSCADSSTASVAVVSTTTSSAQLSFSAPASTTTCTFDVTVADTAGNVSDPATMTVNVTAGGDQVSEGISQEVIGGVLDLSACGTTNPDPSTCLITMSPVQLDGQSHTSHGAIEQLTVSDARGMPAGWTLTATAPVPLQNTNSSLTGPNSQISQANLTLSDASCAASAGNLNPNPTAGAGGSLDGVVTICSADAGSNSGGFTADAALSLLVPSSAYAGTYTGTIDFVVQ